MSCKSTILFKMIVYIQHVTTCVLTGEMSLGDSHLAFGVPSIIHINHIIFLFAIGRDPKQWEHLKVVTNLNKKTQTNIKSWKSQSHVSLHVGFVYQFIHSQMLTRVTPCIPCTTGDNFGHCRSVLCNSFLCSRLSSVLLRSFFLLLRWWGQIAVPYACLTCSTPMILLALSSSKLCFLICA